jgi:repressor of nif and glnA expression
MCAVLIFPIMIDKVEKKRLAVLSAIKEAGRPLNGAYLTAELIAHGFDVSERTVRLYLQEMDRDGLTENLGRRGRRITAKGLEELGAARVIEKLGLLSAKIDQITFLMDFELTRRTGTVVINLSVVNPKLLAQYADKFCRVFEKGFAMGRLMTLVEPGERVGDLTVPAGQVGVGTVCSVTINGALLQKGIPVHSRFGGLLELHDSQPTRFVDIITYDGTTLDPLEVFIRSGMTDYLGAINTGNGRIGASFREFPSASRHRVRELARQLEEVGLGGFMLIGGPARPLLEVPVGEGRVGAVVIGGLNPLAIFEESGERVLSQALAGLVEFERLFPYYELEDRLKRIM